MTEAAGAGAVVQDVLANRAPQHIRSAAARGALPFPRTTMVRLQVHLLADADPTIQAAARASLDSLEADAVRECLTDGDCDGNVLAFFSRSAARNETLAESIVFHSNTPRAALMPLAASASIAVVDLILTNQERLLAEPQLLDGLMSNPALRPAQRGRILELLETVEKRRLEAAATAVPDTGEAVADEAIPLEDVADLLEVDVGDLLSASEIIDGEEFAVAEEPEIRSAYQKIITLNTAQKAVLAMKGGREERLILVRDTNKTVSLGVLKNPRITETEIEAIAKLRNVSEEILRYVGSKREWTKKYTVVLGLVTNPRAPQSVVMNHVTRLTTKDLRGLVSSREIPELIRRHARRIYEQRTKPQSSFKKK